MRQLIFIILCLSCFKTFGQLRNASRPDASDRFIAFISPMSTRADLDTILNDLEAAGFRIALRDFIFTPDGKLKSFYAQIVSECADPDYQYTGTTDFSLDGQYSLAAMVIGQDCSTGVFTTTFDNLKQMYEVFFPDEDPAHFMYAWKGAFEDAKNVVWEESR